MPDELNQQTETSYIQPSAALQSQFSLGQWLVQPQLNRIQHRHSSLQRQLEPRLIKLLCFLGANPQRVLSRDELVAELWPKVIVNENSLTRAVSELRKQLELPGDANTAFIETIPKKGYRLIPAMSKEELANDEGFGLWNSLAANFSWQTRFQQSAGIVALCLSLVSVSWLGFDTGYQSTISDSVATPIVDVVMEAEPDFFGGEVTLSGIEGPEFVAQKIETPVVSNDGSQYAYLQFDNTGSTIFLGNLDEMTEPTAVFNSQDFLYNLTWSPVGNALMFARKPTLTTTALFSSSQQVAELYLLDLESLESRRLIQERESPESESASGLNLT